MMPLVDTIKKIFRGGPANDGDDEAASIKTIKILLISGHASGNIIEAISRTVQFEQQQPQPHHDEEHQDEEHQAQPHHAQPEYNYVFHSYPTLSANVTVKDLHKDIRRFVNHDMMQQRCELARWQGDTNPVVGNIAYIVVHVMQVAHEISKQDKKIITEITTRIANLGQDYIPHLTVIVGDDTDDAHGFTFKVDQSLRKNIKKRNDLESQYLTQGGVFKLNAATEVEGRGSRFNGDEFRRFVDLAKQQALSKFDKLTPLWTGMWRCAILGMIYIVIVFAAVGIISWQYVVHDCFLEKWYRFYLLVLVDVVIIIYLTLWAMISLEFALVFTQSYVFYVCHWFWYFDNILLWVLALLVIIIVSVLALFLPLSYVIPGTGCIIRYSKRLLGVGLPAFK